MVESKIYWGGPILMVSYTDTLAKFGVGGAHPGGLQLTRQLLKDINFSKDENLLDVGCGTGQTIEFVELNYDCPITGIEPHKEMLKKAQSRINKLGLESTVIMGKAEQLPCDDEKFDVVLSESVTAFTSIKKSLSEYYRVLKTNGKLVMVEMTLTNNLSSHSKKEVSNFYSIPTLCTEKDWHHELALRGFQNITSYEVTTPSSLDDIEMDTSEDLQASHFEIMNQHQMFLEKYKEHLKPFVYYAEKQ